MEQWTEKQVTFIERNFLKMSNKDLAAALGKTIPALKGKLRALKLTRSKETKEFSPVKGERWKKVDETYSVSSAGRVRNDQTKVIRRTNVNKFGYERVTLTGNKSHLIHRLVAEAFIPNPEKLPEVNHKDGVKTNNHVDNLEWCTEEYNLRHAGDLGLRNTNGENSPKAKMTEAQAIKVCELLELGKSSTEIMTAVGSPVSKTMVDKIRSGLRWKHISCKYSISK